MKVYVVTSGEYSDYRIHHIFLERKHAEAYEGGDEVIEWDVLEHPIEQRTWHEIIWSPKIPDRDGDSLAMSNPHTSEWPRDYGGEPGYPNHHWTSRGQEIVLCVQGWDPDRVYAVYLEQRSQYEAQQER